MTVADVHPLDGVLPEAVYEPADEREAAEVVREAGAARLPLVPLGGGTALGAGNALDGGRFAYLSTRRLGGVADLSPADAVVSIRAGCTLAEAQRALAPHRQLLAIDVPGCDRATIGGITACNRQGPWRASFGLPRDRLLAIRAVIPDGTVVKGGGKVVKTVAGYDLCRLLAGSWGTLGLIVEATFRTQPEPPEVRHVAAVAPDAASAARAALDVMARHLEPTTLTVHGGPPWYVSAAIWGNADLVHWHCGELGRLWADAGLVLADGPGDAAVRDHVAGSTLPCIARLSVRPSEVPAVLGRVSASSDCVAADALCGVVEAALEPGTIVGTDWVARLAAAAPPPSRVTWPRVPVEWKARLDVWGGLGADVALQRAVKRALDPERLFSPGRFVGRL